MSHSAVESVIGRLACEEFAARLDPRIQRVDLRRTATRPSEHSALAPALGDVVAFLDGRSEDTCVAEFAGALAHEHSAHLTAVLAVPEPSLRPDEMFVRGSAIASLVAEREELRRETAAERRHLLERVFGHHGIEAEWRVIRCFTNFDATVHARYGDLAVIARPDAGQQHGGDRALIDSLILASGRPLIVVPPRYADSGIRRVLVAWNAGRESARAVADALPVLARAAAVAVLTVDPHPGEGGHGEEPGADVARYLARHGATVDVRCVSSAGKSVGRVILAEARDFDADLVVIGGYGRSRWTERLFGGVTRTVLHESELPVLVSH